MKKIVALAFGICVLTGAVKAQTLDSKFGLDSVKTIENASIYAEFFKQKNYTDALPAWRYVFKKAPAYSINTYLRGTTLMKEMFKKTKDYAYIDTLMMVYEQRLKYFDDNQERVYGMMGTDLGRLGKDDAVTRKRAYSYMLKALQLEGKKAHPLTIKMTFTIADDLLKKNAITRDEYVNLYMKLSNFTEEKIKTAKDPKEFSETKSIVDGFFFASGVADCATLERFLTPKYEANKTDLENLKEISSLLRRSECSDLPLFAKVAEALYKQDPTSDAAYNLATMFLKNQELGKAEAYLKEAVAKSTVAADKATYNLRLAQLCVNQKQYPEAKRYLMESLKNDPNSGNAYLLLGQVYAFGSASYGQDDYDHATVFWAAVDKFNRAKQVDPGVSGKADELINTYRQHFPLKDDGFFRNVLPGNEVKIGGWINETTTARFRQ